MTSDDELSRILRSGRCVCGSNRKDSWALFCPPCLRWIRDRAPQMERALDLPRGPKLCIAYDQAVRFLAESKRSVLEIGGARRARRRR